VLYFGSSDVEFVKKQKNSSTVFVNKDNALVCLKSMGSFGIFLKKKLKN